MAFFRRIMDHLLNQVLVETLANSRWFQRFAVWSHSKMQDINAVAKDPNAKLETATKAAKETTESWAKWRKEVMEEVRRLQGKQPPAEKPPGAS